jgi:branched-chain amino acid transport system substrate-binding protein
MNRSTRDHRPRGLRPLTALVALALVVAACGDDDDDDDASSPATTEAAAATTEAAPATTEAAPATTAAAPATTEAAPATTEASSSTEGSEAMGDPVTIAVLTDETGPTPIPLVDVTQAAIDAINADGGLNGHPIEIQTWDVKTDAAAAQAAVAEIPTDAIAVLLSSSGTEASIADSLSALNIPILGVGYNPGVWGGSITPFQLNCAANADFCANPNFFTTATTADAVIAEQLVAAKEAGATKVTSVVCAEVDSCSTSIPVFEAIAQSLGLEVSPAVKVSSTATDYSAECIGAIQDGVDFMQVSASSATATNLAASCNDQGYEGIFGASAGSVNTTILAIDGTFAGGLNGFPWFVDDPKVAEYRDIMEGAGVSEDLWGSPHATGFYADLLLLQKALADYADPAAPLDGAAALAAMYQVKDEDLDGLLASPLTFTEDNLDRHQECFWPFIKQADGGIDNPLGGLTTSCFPGEA